MTNLFAPDARARRILIAALAFLLAVALAVATTATPAEAAKDPKEFSAATDTTSVDALAVETFVVTFTNEKSNTQTQRAGSFLADFGAAGFTSVSAATPVSQNGTWEVVSVTNGKVVISALSGSDRILPDQSVSVAVTATAPEWSGPDPDIRTVPVEGDQEDHGNFKKGSNQFVDVGDPVQITIIEPENEAPDVTIDSPAAGSLAGTSTTVEVSASFTDDQNSGHTCSIDWGDGNVTVGDVDEDAGTCEGSHDYDDTAAPSTDRIITVTVTDSFLAPGYASVAIEVFNGQVADCASGDTCSTAAEDDGQDGSATTACDGTCDTTKPSGGYLQVDLQEGEECQSFNLCAIFMADTTAEDAGDFFYLIVQVPPKLKRSAKPVYVDETTLEIVVAQTCATPRDDFCLDKDHPAWNHKTGTFPIKFPAKDPRGGWGR